MIYDASWRTGCKSKHVNKSCNIAECVVLSVSKHVVWFNYCIDLGLGIRPKNGGIPRQSCHGLPFKHLLLSQQVCQVIPDFRNSANITFTIIWREIAQRWWCETHHYMIHVMIRVGDFISDLPPKTWAWWRQQESRCFDSNRGSLADAAPERITRMNAWSWARSAALTLPLGQRWGQP